MKKVLYIALTTLAAGYIIAAGIFFARKTGRQEAAECKEVEIVVADSLKRPFVTSADIVNYLKRAGIYPLNKKMKNINMQELENAVLKNEIIEKAEVVRTVSGKIKIVISQKTPILRVFSAGGSYYVDRSGRTMPVVSGQAVYVPVASGNIDKSLATTDLYTFAQFLQENDFWNDQITQIYVRSKDDVEIVPRAGNHRILLGGLDNYEDKLGRLRLFYEQVIPKMGWDKYSVVNLKYKNQIVCTKNKNSEQ